ncbi:unnamed protein product [Rhodiola kirilowii]
MEFHLLSFPIISTFAIFIFFVAKLVKKSSSRNANLPPGPCKLPFIGNLHQLASSTPHRKLRDLANKYGPLMHLQLGEVSTMIVSSPDVAQEVMKTHDANFASRPRTISSRIISYDGKDIVFAPYGDYWRHMRKICNLELLNSKRVQSLKPIRDEEMENLNRFILTNAGNPINLTQNVASYMYGIISRAAIGGKLKDLTLLIALIKEAVNLSAGFNAADFYPSVSFIHKMSGAKAKMEAVHKEIDKILNEVISEHEQSMAGTSCPKVNEDIVHILLKLKYDTEVPLEQDHIKAVVLDVLGAGSDTSSRTVDWAMSELLKNPREMKKVQEELRNVFDENGDVDESQFHKLKYLNMVIKEVLRLHLPAPLLIPRENSERCVVNGFEVPSKTKIIINGWALARDPKYWTDPEKFYPERFLDSSLQLNGNEFHYVPFGAGRRICPGLTLGVTNVEVFMANLLFHFDWELPNGEKGEDMDMSEMFGATIARKQELVIVPILYQKSVLAKVK